MCRRARAALFALLGAVVLLSVACGPAGAAVDEGGANVTFEIALEEDGDAQWTVQAYFDLQTTAEQEAFNELAAAYREGEARSLGLEAFRNASERAAAATGRSMRITDVSRAAAPVAVVRNGTGWL
ncbi:MAG: hypothetical protein ABEH64_03055, partial [Salinirussus sp.]